MLRQNGDPDPEGTIQILEEERQRGIYPLGLLMKQQQSGNNGQGPGVSTDDNAPESDRNKKKKE
jgi:hypothetical protein